jgi:hypothetical protein
VSIFNYVPVRLGLYGHLMEAVNQKPASQLGKTVLGNKESMKYKEITAQQI